VGLSLEEPLVAALDFFGLDRKNSPVFIQCAGIPSVLLPWSRRPVLWFSRHGGHGAPLAAARTERLRQRAV